MYGFPRMAKSFRISNEISYLIHYNTLLQNATDIMTECRMRQLFYYKMRQKCITKCARFFIKKCESFIRTCDSYYKM